MAGKRADAEGLAARCRRILALVEAGVVRVDSIAAELNVSTSTARRDLAKLVESGHVVRTYGGVALRGGFYERALSESAAIRFAAKKAIAKTAADHIGPAQIVFLDAGSTCGAVSELLYEREDLTVVTRGLEAAQTLVSSPSVTVQMLGGHLRRLSHGLVGPLTLLALERMRFDVAILGADAVHPVLGLGEPTVEETYVKERVAAVSGRVFIVADSSKLNAALPPAWTKIRSTWSVITDGDVSADVKKEFSTAGIDVIVAPVPS